MSRYDLGCYYEFSDAKDFSRVSFGVLCSVKNYLSFPYEMLGNGDGKAEAFKYIRELTVRIGRVREPKPLKGFVNIYYDGYKSSPTHGTKEIADEKCNPITRLACIDLSQFNEGEGL